MSESEELNYLNMTKCEITKKIDELEKEISNQKQDIICTKKYLWENLYEMDPIEIAFERQNIEFDVDTNVEKSRKLYVFNKLLLSPYFGRVDFKIDGEEFDEDNDKYYIGLSSFVLENLKFLVYDWRAPVASLFYDYEVGEAKYFAPMGDICGEIILKRQYKVKNGELEYMFDSSLKIDDEILQKELSNNTSSKMRNIVSTIQKEQNKIIRNDNKNTLVVQGVAGSGKTSIALHRVAYLLYKYKDTIKSNNVLIISPNKVFSDYISNVLPELGEENIIEMSFEDLAMEELKKIAKCETRYENIERLLQNNNSQTQIDSIKGSVLFLEYMKEFVNSLTNEIFESSDFEYQGFKISKEYIDQLYFKKFANKELFIRLAWIAEAIIEKIEVDLDLRLTKSSKSDIKEQVKRMCRNKNILHMYNEFLFWVKTTKNIDICSYDNGQALMYEDVYPLILLKHLLNGSPDFRFVKHLLIDEMQDYTPIQYEIINRMFNCSKTILGDIMQIINTKINISTLDNIKLIFGNDTQLITLNKSYRSTIEITKLAQNIINDKSIEPIERHGTKPQLINKEDYLDIVESIKLDIEELNKEGYTSIAVLCKTMSETNAIYKSLINAEINIKLIDYKSESFEMGSIITTSYLAKGLEFDGVILLDVNSENYNSDADRQSLYVGCTRALHVLKLYYTGTISKFIENAKEKDLITC